MSLSAEDIVGYRFKQSLRGYAIDEVDELLDQVADQVERTDAELAELRERVRVAEEQAASAARTEQALRRTLVAAQETAERVVAEAEREAETHRAQASADADRLRSEARREAEELVREAQGSARREASAARSRVDEAAARHREVLDGVAEHRDALRAHLRQLEELVEAGVSADDPEPVATDLVGGELATDTDGSRGQRTDDELDRRVADVDAAEDRDQTGTDGPGTGPDEVDDVAGAQDDPPQVERPAEGLTIRVHDDASGASAPLGSEPRGGR